MRVRAYEARDRAEWTRMRALLWPGEHLDDADADDWLATSTNAVLVAERDGGGLCGFVEVGERSVVDGCVTSPVGYLEGWWVDPDVRRRGVGAALVRAFEGWARARGYREVGSDALIDNVVSHRAHAALGFEEVCRVVNFRKTL